VAMAALVVLNEEAVEIGEAAGAGSSKVSCGLRHRSVGEAGRAGPSAVGVVGENTSNPAAAVPATALYTAWRQATLGRLNVVGKYFVSCFCSGKLLPLVFGLLGPVMRWWLCWKKIGQG